MSLLWKTRAAPSVSDSSIGGAAADAQVAQLIPQTPAELSTAHAQLTLLEGAMRAVVASTGSCQASTQSHLKPADLRTSTGTMAEVLAPSATAARSSTASERLAALHDNLRRLRHLMQQYEETSQRVIEVHLIPSPETGEPTFSSVAKPTALAGKKKVSPQRPSDSAAVTERLSISQRSSNSADDDSNGRRNSPVFGNPRQVAGLQKASPSLHQRRALASDAVFSRFCGLHVTPDQLLLPLDSPASPNTVTTLSMLSQQLMSPRGLLLMRGIDDGVADKEKRGEGSSAGRDAAAVKTCGSSNTARSAQTHGCASAKDRDNSGTSSSLNSLSSSTAQQRQRANAEAVLEAYAKLFYHPFVPAVSPPVAPPHGTQAAAPGPPFSSTLASDAEVTRELQDTRDRLAALQRCNLFAYEKRLRAEAAAAENRRVGDKMSSTADEAGPVKRRAANSAQVDDIKWQHIPIAVQHMQDGVTALQVRFTRDSHYASCGGQSIALVRQLSAWTQPLLQQLNELLSKGTLEEMEESTREKLRRMKFDVEELQQAQAESITNGDMQRSEELYYEQTSVAEAMAAPYDALEAAMLNYREVCVDAPLKGLLERRDLLMTQLKRMVEEHTSKLSEVTLDLERVKEKRRAVAQARHRQRNSMSAYHHSWKKAWQTNSDQQMACCRAMEELEKQLNDLQQAQGLLVDDWIRRVSHERQREEDAAAFACFVDARAAALGETQSNLQAVVEGVRQYSEAVEFSCRHTEAFVHEVLQDHLSESQLALRKDRLEQFRSLYLTLGDLRFKKARNADEIQKRIDHYALQQEIAMDALNPKAKEFSKAKQRWESAKVEALKELDQLDQRSSRQLEGFQETERLLREAGVSFVSPEEELARRTEQRSQKLLEYQQLIEEGIGVRTTTGTSSAPFSVSPQLTPLEVSTPSAKMRSSACTEAVAGLPGPNPPPPSKMRAFGELHFSLRWPTSGEAADRTTTFTRALGGKNGPQLPPLRGANCTYPPPQRTENIDDNGDESLAPTVTPGPSSQAWKPTSAAAVVAAAPTAAPVSSLHSTEEWNKQVTSKTAQGDRSKTGTISSATFLRSIVGKR